MRATASAGGCVLRCAAFVQAGVTAGAADQPGGALPPAEHAQRPHTAPEAGHPGALCDWLEAAQDLRADLWPRRLRRWSALQPDHHGTEPQASWCRDTGGAEGGEGRGGSFPSGKAWRAALRCGQRPLMWVKSPFYLAVPPMSDTPSPRFLPPAMLPHRSAAPHAGRPLPLAGTGHAGFARCAGYCGVLRPVFLVHGDGAGWVFPARGRNTRCPWPVAVCW